MLDQMELTQVRDYVIKVLPDLLRNEPEIATTIEGILAQQFPRRDEFARLLERLEAQDRWTTTSIQDLRADMTEGFDQVDRRFEQVDQRFDQVDQRFDQVGQRFDQVDQRFEQVDRRFEQVDGRLGKMDQTMLSMRRDIVKLDHGQQTIINRMDAQERWLRFTIGQLHAEKGETMEDLFAAALRYGLKDPDISPEQINLRQKLVDSKGLVFKRKFETEVDIIARDGQLIIFEVKAGAKPSDVDTFALKVELLAANNSDKQVEGVLVALGASKAVQERCQKLGITLID